MGKTISIYVDDQDLSFLDRLAKSERRSRSAMLGEVIRRYLAMENTRSYTSRELERFLKEDKKVSAKEINAFRKKLGLPKS